MTQRLPNLGESPYKTILDGYLEVNHDVDGTQKPLFTFSTGVTRAAVPTGQSNLFSAYHTPTSVGTVQQVGFGIEMTGIAAGGSSVFRIPLFIGAQTGGGVGANGLDGINIVVQQNAADDVAYLNGAEIAFNNNKRDDPLNPTDQNHYGLTLDVYGGHSTGPAALAIRKGAASSTWQRGVWVPVGTITPTTGFFLAYDGNGAGRVFTVDEAANVVIGNALTFPTAGVNPSAGPAVWNNAGSVLNFAGGSDSTRFYSSTLGAELARITNAGIVLIGTTVTTSAAAGDLVLANAKALRSVNGAGTGTLILARLVGASNAIQLGPDGSSWVQIAGPGSTTGATAGDLLIANAKSVRSANAGASGTLILIRADASDRVQLAPDGGDILWGKALVAMGGGSPATLGTIGGTGPTVAGQNTWMRVIDSSGAAFWVPAWK
jgi:hypothetical protein